MTGSELHILDYEGPEEPEQAFLLWAAQMLETGAVSAEDVRSLFVTTPFRFKYIPDEEQRLYTQINLREAATATYQAMSRSATQRIFEICQWRDRRVQMNGNQSGSIASIVQDWSTHISQSRSSEPITETWLTSCFRLWENLFKHESLRVLVLNAEKKYGRSSPCDKISTLEAVLSKGKTVEMMTWLLGYLNWVVDNKQFSGSELSIRALTGKGSGVGNRGLSCKHVPESPC